MGRKKASVEKTLLQVRIPKDLESGINAAAEYSAAGSKSVYITNLIYKDLKENFDVYSQAREDMKRFSEGGDGKGV